MLVANGCLEAAEIDERVEGWRNAYLHTPHGRPVVLGGGRDAEANL